MSKLSIGAVFFPGFEMLDIYGPLELFSMHRDAFEIVAVGERKEPIPASGGPSTMPDAVFGDDRLFDMVIVPGGRGVRDEKTNPEMVRWLVQQAAGGAWMTSVCTGSLLLAVAGLLDGRRATTNKIAFDWVAEHRPQVHWQPMARWVRDGKFITASGVSAGMDMAVDIIRDLQGEKAAKEATEWAEYVANTDPDNDPFARSET